MTCKVLSASGTINQLTSLQGQIDSLRLTANQANLKLERSVNPADVSLMFLMIARQTFSQKMPPNMCKQQCGPHYSGAGSILKLL